MPSVRDLIEGLTEALPDEKLDLPIYVRVGGRDVPLYLDRISIAAEPPHEDGEGVLWPGRTFVRIVAS